MSKIKTTNDSLCWRRYGESVHSSISDRNGNLYSPLEISMVISQKNPNQSTSRPNNFTLRHIPKGCTFIPQGLLFSRVHCSFICNSQNLKCYHRAFIQLLRESEAEIHR